MTNSVVTPDVWSVLLPVIIGGALPILGAAVGPLVTQWLSSRESSRSERIKRFEELLSLVQAQDDWLNLHRAKNAFGQMQEIPAPPLAQALAVAALYFPQFVQDLKRLDEKSTLYVGWTSQAGLRRLNGQIEKINDGFSEVFQDYWNTFVEVRGRIIDHAMLKNGNI